MSLNDLIRRPELCEHIWGFLWIQPDHEVMGDAEKNALYKLYHLCEFPDPTHFIRYFAKADAAKMNLLGEAATRPVEMDEFIDAVEILRMSDMLEAEHLQAEKISRLRALPWRGQNQL
ncbi:hypothetical protein GCM10029992_36940 [Glycomyces albus]